MKKIDNFLENYEFPRKWEIVKLEEICNKIKAGGTPSTRNREYWNGEIPFVKIEDIASSSKYLNKTLHFISKKGLENSSAWIVPKNSILLAMYGSLGELAINKISVATNQAIIAIITNEDVCDLEFLYYWLLYFKPNWKKFAKPTTQANLTANIVRNILIPLPPLPEQKKIAEILSTVDKAIEKVDEAIAKTEKLKKGLMQELLTKGIGHKEFKYSKELGCEIPKEWAVVKIENILTLKNGERPELSKNGNIPIYGANGVMGFSKDYLTDRDYTLIIGRVGASGEVHLATGKIWISDNAIYSEQYNKLKSYLPFIFYMLKFKDLKRFATKTTHPIITQTFLKSLKIPFPPLEEQRKIAEILSTVDKKLELERKRKEKLERIKKGLMNDLLTGRKRVKL